MGWLEPLKEGRLPLLDADLSLDDDGALVVFVFPHFEDGSPCTGWQEEVIEPSASASKIFTRPLDDYQGMPLFDESSLDEAMTKDTYRNMVRSAFVDILQRGGMQTTTSTSPDQTEVFLKVAVGDNREVLAELAHVYHYKMPITSGYERMYNDEGAGVMIYADYSPSLADRMESFRQIDELRLLMHFIRDAVDIEEMIAQGVMIRWFPTANYQAVFELGHTWANLQRIVCMPTPGDDDLVRNYFGEEIGFFFAWYGVYIRYLVLLALGAGLIVALRAAPGHGLFTRAYLLNVFGGFVIVVVAGFNEHCTRKAARLKQRWGMKDWDLHHAMVRPAYKPELDASSLGRVYKIAATQLAAMYGLFFAGAVMWLQLVGRTSPGVMSVFIQVASWIWGKVAGHLVSWENHRTEARYNDSLSWTLASVKLFVALFPFINIAFLEPVINQTCARSLHAAAEQVYRHSGWPVGTAAYDQQVSSVLGENLGYVGDNIAFLAPYSFRKHPGKHCTHGSPIRLDSAKHDASATDHTSSALMLNFTEADLSFLSEYSSVNSEGEHCISGCYPQHCRRVVEGGTERTICSTNCWENLKMQLVCFYLVQVVSALVWLVVPILITKMCIIGGFQTMVKEPNLTGELLRSVCGQVERPSASVLPGGPVSYLQFQSRRHDEMAYEYYSWGGSYTEDFLGLAIGYSLTACFCQVVPEMVIVGLACNMVIYRILAYRMLHVTSRPWPWGAEGLGMWSQILDVIATLAVTCNVALATFVMPPIAFWPMHSKLLFFILAEKGLHLLRSAVRFGVKELPDDVIRIEDHNRKAKQLLRVESSAESQRFKNLFKVLVPTESELKVRNSVRSRGSRASNLGPPEFTGGQVESQASEIMQVVRGFFSR